MGDTERRLTSLFSELNVKPFSSWSYETKCAYKDRRLTPHLDIKIADSRQNRKFQFSWYKKYPWLTGCSEKNKLYCYTCILSGGEKEWSSASYGVCVTKNFDRKAEKHQCSRRHLQNEETFLLLGRGRIEHSISEGAKLQAMKHNEIVKQNRFVIERLIDVVCFLGKQELAFRGHFEDESSDSKGNYLELLELLSRQEQFLRDHLQCTSSFKGTSSTIQNELIESVTDVINERIKEELHSCEFVSVQADETLDVSCKTQMSIILRFCTQDGPKERFIGFYDVSKDKTAVGLSEVIIHELNAREITDKIVSQTYDGASVMAGDRGGVQQFVKQVCPRATFLHCYAHKLNLVLLYCSKSIKQVRLFVYNLAAFHTFFSKSSKRTQLLENKGFRLPQTCTTRWNFNSRAVHTIYAKYNKLKDVFHTITDNIEEWDAESFNCASGLLNILNKTQFTYLLCLYKQIFVYIDHLFALLQNKVTSDINMCNTEIQKTIGVIKNMRSENTVKSCVENSKKICNDLSISEQEFGSFKLLTYEILDTLTVQMETRFGDIEKIRFVELLDQNSFGGYKLDFPAMKLNNLLSTYPFFNKERLENELKNIYVDEEKHLPPVDLLKFITSNGLQTIYKEVTRLIKLVLTFPVTTASSERSMSTLKRIKNCLRNSMTNERLSSLSTIAIEKSLVKELSMGQSFKERVIDIFATKKNRRVDLLYKKI